MATQTMQALVQQDGKLTKQTIDRPIPGPNQVLVKVSFAAQNPTDIQSLDGNAFGDGAVLGCDFAGVVEDIGSSVSRFNKGQAIAGLIWGGERKFLGAYSEYTLADESICFPVPEGFPLEDASTVPLAACTAELAFFSDGSLGIPRGSADGQTILIWGGSTAVGQYAIQIARLHGMNVVTTCSPKNNDSVKERGAQHYFDYRDPEVVDKIRSVAPNIKYAFDTVGNEKSSVTAAQALSKDGGVICTVRPGKQFTEGVPSHVKVTDVLVFTAFLKEHQYGKFHWPVIEQDHKIASEFFSQLPSLLADKKIKASVTKVYKGGLDDIPKGFEEYRKGDISNYKIVYQL